MRIEALDLFGVFEHVRQLVEKPLLLVLTQLETREPCDAIDVCAGQPPWHAKCYHAIEVSLRRAAVAGSWYPANPEALAREVDRYLVAVEGSPAGDTVALVAPHAGLVYSGAIAAHAYRPLRDQAARGLYASAP